MDTVNQAQLVIVRMPELVAKLVRQRQLSRCRQMRGEKEVWLADEVLTIHGPPSTRTYHYTFQFMTSLQLLWS